MYVKTSCKLFKVILCNYPLIITMSNMVGFKLTYKDDNFLQHMKYGYKLKEQSLGFHLMYHTVSQSNLSPNYQRTKIQLKVRKFPASVLEFQGSHIGMAAILNMAIFESGSISKNTSYVLQKGFAKFHACNKMCTKCPKIDLYLLDYIRPTRVNVRR